MLTPRVATRLQVRRHRKIWDTAHVSCAIRSPRIARVFSHPPATRTVSTLDCLHFNHGSRTELVTSRKTAHRSSPLGALTLSSALGFLLLASGCGSDHGSLPQTQTQTQTQIYSLGGTVSGLSGS